jgi:hypothetical protein
MQAIREHMRWINDSAFAGYVAALTMGQAAALGMVHLGLTRVRRRVGASEIFVFLAIGAILAGSHYQYWTGGPEPNVGQLWMAYLIVPCWIAFTFIGWKARVRRSETQASA